jgi:hypothetical protein
MVSRFLISVGLPFAAFREKRDQVKAKGLNYIIGMGVLKIHIN